MKNTCCEKCDGKLKYVEQLGNAAPREGELHSCKNTFCKCHTPLPEAGEWHGKWEDYVKYRLQTEAAQYEWIKDLITSLLAARDKELVEEIRQYFKGKWLGDDYHDEAISQDLDDFIRLIEKR